MTCPNCEEEINIEFDYEGPDPSVGIFGHTYIALIDNCLKCEHKFTDKELDLFAEIKSESYYDE